MTLDSIARTMGVTRHALDELIAGRSSDAIAARLRTGSILIQDFIDGQTRDAVAAMIGAPTAFVQDLRDEIGSKGAVGLIIGLCIDPKR